jgi:putative transcriptional regulator
MKTRIKEFRARYDLTQQDLADRVGVSRMTIVFLEKGTYNPSLLLAHRVATVLGTSMEELFIFEEEEVA